MTPSDEMRVNWFRIIVNLNRKKLSTRAFAAMLKIPRSTIDGWKQGAEPKHSDGERLISLWCKTLGRVRAEVPMVSVFDFRA